MLLKGFHQSCLNFAKHNLVPLKVSEQIYRAEAPAILISTAESTIYFLLPSSSLSLVLYLAKLAPN